MKTEIQIEGLDKLIARVNDPDLVGEPLKDLLQAAANTGYAVARHNIAGGTEQAQMTIRTEVQPLVAKVYSVMPEPRALSIEEGRQPGEVPPFAQIVHWVKGQYASVRNVTPAERKQFLEIQASIRASGTKGKKFLAGAAAAIKRDLPGFIQVTATKIMERWRASRGL